MTKRKSGLSSDTTYKIKRALVSRLQDIISSTIQFKLTHDEMSRRVTAEVFHAAEKRKLPLHAVEFLNGYYEARRDEIYRYHIIWMLWCDDVLLTSDEVNILTREEEKLGLHKKDDYKSPWQRIDSTKSRHVWKDIVKNKILFNKPYDERFLRNDASGNDTKHNSAENPT